MTSDLKTKAFTLLKVSSLSLLISSSLLVSSNPAQASVEGQVGRQIIKIVVPRLPGIINRRERKQSSAVPTHKLQYENAKIF